MSISWMLWRSGFFSESIKRIKSCRKDDEYAIVISCHGDEENLTSKPKFEAYYPLDTSNSNQ